jgi:bilin biosynthesis protein
MKNSRISDMQLKLWFSELMGEDPERQMKAMMLLEKEGERVIEPLLEVLKHPNENVRTSASVVLSNMGKPALKHLVNAIMDKIPTVRTGAAFALGQIKDKSAVPALINALKDEDAKVRMMAAFSLGEIGNSEAIKPLVQGSRDDSEDVRKAAMNALTKIKKASDTRGTTDQPAEVGRGGIESEGPEKHARNLAALALKTAEDMSKQEEALKMIEEAISVAERHGLSKLKNQLDLIKTVTRENIKKREAKKNKWKFWKRKKKREPIIIYRSDGTTSIIYPEDD